MSSHKLAIHLSNKTPELEGHFLPGAIPPNPGHHRQCSWQDPLSLIATFNWCGLTITITWVCLLMDHDYFFFFIALYRQEGHSGSCL